MNFKSSLNPSSHLGLSLEEQLRESMKHVKTLPELLKQWYSEDETWICRESDDLQKKGIEDYYKFVLEKEETIQNAHSSTTTDFVAQLDSMEIESFMDVRETQFLDFKSLKQGSLHLIVGINGSGKSTLLEAIFWCL